MNNIFTVILFSLFFNIFYNNVFAFDSASSSAGMYCRDIFVKSPQWQWRHDDDYFKALRSNVPHFWEWVQINGEKYLSKELVANRGHISADPHTFNYGPIQASKYDYFWGFNDFDDSGFGPLIYDIAYNVIRDKAQQVPGLRLKDLVAAYREGVLGIKYEKPECIQDLERLSKKKIKKKNKKFFNKMVTDDEKFDLDEELEYHPISELNADQKAYFKSHYDAFVAALPDKQVMDVVYRIKTTGGSQGLVRFLFLLKGKKGNYHIFEFKPPPKRSGADYYEPQEPNEIRVADSREFFWKSKESDKYQEVWIKDQLYMMRPRLPHYFEIHKEAKFDDLDEDDQVEYLLYIANRKGRNARKDFDTEEQVQSYNQQIMDEEKQLVRLVLDYSRVARAENESP